jgi:PLP dependent protein
MSFEDLPERVAAVRAKVADAVRRGGHGQDVRIIAVTKTHGPDAVRAAWDAGIRDVGENKVQEALAKMSDAEVPVQWHLIGHLQRNKVAAVDRFSMFHALDRARLADAMNRIGLERGRPIDVLVQVNVTAEQSKGGYPPRDVRVEGERLLPLAGLRVCGVMTMARLEAGEAELRETFASGRSAAAVLRDVGHPATELSMGMSGDYEIAVEEGATMIRLGTTLFGTRQS